MAQTIFSFFITTVNIKNCPSLSLITFYIFYSKFEITKIITPALE